MFFRMSLACSDLPLILTERCHKKESLFIANTKLSREHSVAEALTYRMYSAGSLR